MIIRQSVPHWVTQELLDIWSSCIPGKKPLLYHFLLLLLESDVQEHSSNIRMNMYTLHHIYIFTWHDMTWHDMIWHDMTWHDTRYITYVRTYAHTYIPTYTYIPAYTYIRTVGMCLHTYIPASVHSSIPPSIHPSIHIHGTCFMALFYAQVRSIESQRNSPGFPVFSSKSSKRPHHQWPEICALRDVSWAMKVVKPRLDYRAWALLWVKSIV